MLELYVVTSDLIININSNEPLKCKIRGAVLAASIEHMDMPIMMLAKCSSMEASLRFYSRFVPGCNSFCCVFQRPPDSVLIYTSRRIIRSNPLGNVNLTTLKSGMDRLASPPFSDATVVSTVHPISGAVADTCG